MRGITITLYDRTQTGVDAFNAPVYIETAEQVSNVLVYPASDEEITTDLQLYGKRAVYTLAIPKGDTHTWEDKVVEFFGQRFHVFGMPTQGIDHLIPLGWNKKIRVERFE